MTTGAAVPPSKDNIRLIKVFGRSNSFCCVLLVRSVVNTFSLGFPEYFLMNFINLGRVLLRILERDGTRVMMCKENEVDMNVDAG